MQGRAPTEDSASGGPESALAAVAAGLSELLAGVDGAVSGDKLRELVVGVEQQARRMHALQVALMNEVDRQGLHRADGHASAKVMVRHVCQLSAAEAARRAQLGRAVRELPELAEAHRRGAIGTEQMALVARVHANPRVRRALIGFQQGVLLAAESCSYPDFERTLRTWERLADADGPEPRDRAHQGRRLRLRQDPADCSWHLEGSFGPLQGAAINTILRHFAQVEWNADWAEAKAAHGEQATPAHMQRTDAQRMADALEHLCERAASASPSAPGPDVVHNIVWDADTYFATVHRISCEGDGCGAPGHGDPSRWYDPATYRCETIDGDQLDPIEAALSSLGTHVRRVLVRARSVTVDLSHKARLFTGSARAAVQLHSTRCLWPGCWVPATACEIDHIEPHARGGPTNPANGVPLCGRHNRWKQKGYVTWRDPGGHWHVARPDGAEIR